MAENIKIANKIYIVDYLGAHAPQSYYVRNLSRLLSLLPATDVEILSNYSVEEGRSPFLVNQYEGKVWNQAIALYRNYRRLNRLISEYPDAVFIFVTYGNSIDISFIRIAAKARRHVIDVQYTVASSESEVELVVFDFATTYAQRVFQVISHSEATKEFLNGAGYHGGIFSLPCLDKSDSLPEELLGPTVAHGLSGENNGLDSIRSFLTEFNEWMSSNDGK